MTSPYPMAPVQAALYAAYMQWYLARIANPADPYHWLHHYDEATGTREECREWERRYE